MNVLFITREYPPYTVGGVSIHTFNLVKYLQRIGVCCKVISFGDETRSSENVLFVNPSSYIVEKGKASLASTSRIPLDLIRFSQIANNQIKNGDFDVIHVEEPYVGAFIKNSSRSVKVSTFHDTSYGEIKSILRSPLTMSNIKRILFYSILGFYLEFMSIASSKALIVPTPQVKNELQKIYSVSESKIKIIDNGVEIPELDNIENVKAMAKKRLGFDSEKLLIFTIARMVARKRFDLLVKAVRVLHQKPLNGFHVVIAGNGPERESVVGLTGTYGLNDVIDLPGWISEDLRNLFYQAADIFALPSDYEGFPFTMLEAMSYGTAVTNSEIESLSKMRNGIDSLVFPPGDYMGLSACLEKLLTDHSLRMKLSQSSRIFAEKYDWKGVAKETLRFYKELAN